MHDNTRKMLMQWLDISPHFDFKCADWSVRLNITTILKGYCFHITHTSGSLLYFAKHHLETNSKRISVSVHLSCLFTLNKSWADCLTSNALNHHCALKIYNIKLWISRKSATVPKRNELNWVKGLPDLTKKRLLYNCTKKKYGSLWIMSPFENFGTAIFNNFMEYSREGSTTWLEWAYIV